MVKKSKVVGLKKWIKEQDKAKAKEKKVKALKKEKMVQQNKIKMKAERVRLKKESEYKRKNRDWLAFQEYIRSVERFCLLDETMKLFREFKPSYPRRYFLNKSSLTEKIKTERERNRVNVMSSLMQLVSMGAVSNWYPIFPRTKPINPNADFYKRWYRNRNSEGWASYADMNGGDGMMLWKTLSRGVYSKTMEVREVMHPKRNLMIRQVRIKLVSAPKKSKKLKRKRTLHLNVHQL